MDLKSFSLKKKNEEKKIAIRTVLVDALNVWKVFVRMLMQHPVFNRGETKEKEYESGEPSGG